MDEFLSVEAHGAGPRNVFGQRTPRGRAIGGFMPARPEQRFEPKLVQEFLVVT